MPRGPFLHVAGPRGDRAGVAGRGVRVSRGRRGSVRVRVWRTANSPAVASDWGRVS